MLVQFTTKHGQLTMLGEPAIALIRLGGHSGTVPGAVLAADLPEFLQRLRAGLVARGEEYSPAPAPRDTSRDRDDDEPRERPVNLRNRALPLLDMLETAVSRGSDLLFEKS